MDKLRLLNKNVRLMARRYDFPTLKDTIKRHNPQVVEFDGLKFTNKELKHCKELGILSMPYYTGFNLDIFKALFNSGVDILHLKNPKLIKKICTSTILCGRGVI
jgi:hypothetical protein